MPSINDVLKEKFKVTGNNIAETLSKIEPGSGGGSSDNVLTVEFVRTDGSSIITLNKTFKEIVSAFPNVRFINLFDMDGYLSKDTTSTYHLDKTPVSCACIVLFADAKFTFSSDTEDGVMQCDPSNNSSPT